MTEKFQLKKGGELEIRLVSDFYISRVRNAARKKHLSEHHDGQEPTPPTHTVHYGGGTIPTTGQKLPSWEEDVAYTEESISDVNLKVTRPDRILWAEYVQATNELLRVENIAAWEIYWDRGVVDNPPDDDGWAKIQLEDSIEVPSRTDRRAYKLHWLDTEVLLNQQEATWLALTIKGQGEQVREMQRVAAEMFRGPVDPDRADD